jgi:hypothetical protein|tara:strand:+ start:1134 stop:1340 length:207 start_codon:yes stop_codon:yes gene_type:complete
MWIGIEETGYSTYIVRAEEIVRLRQTSSEDIEGRVRNTNDWLIIHDIDGETSFDLAAVLRALNVSDIA